MDEDCAVCGAEMGRSARIWCDDCRAAHRVCLPCADDLADGTEGYRRVA